MKKIIILVCFSLLLTGCVSSVVRTEILEKLQKENYIKSDWKEVDTVVNSNSPVPSIRSYEYIYEDKNEKLNKIEIYNNRDGEDKYDVTICYDVDKSLNHMNEAIYINCDTRKDFIFEKKKILMFEYWKMTERIVD